MIEKTFLSEWTATVRGKLSAGERPAFDVVTGSLREVVGFPRGATYTAWKRPDKAANVSLTVEPRLDGLGFDVILSPMAGSNAPDGAYKLALEVARMLFPDRPKADDPAKVDRRMSERNKWVAAIGISKNGRELKFTGWEPLPWPEPTYHGSDEPNPERIMVPFLVAASDGSASKRTVYLSLKSDGSDREEVLRFYSEGIRILGVKGSKDYRATQYNPPDGLDEMRDEIKRILAEQDQSTTQPLEAIKAA